jgi:FixJ family two-component response regulator
LIRGWISGAIKEAMQLNDTQRDFRKAGLGDVASTVFLVDCYAAARAALANLLGAAGYLVRLFESAEDFLAFEDTAVPGCLLLDVLLPGMNGIELQRALQSSPFPRPMIFMSKSRDVPTSVQAMKAGAVDFLTKPIDDVCLMDAIEQALQRDVERRRECEIRSLIHGRIASLTPRERQVMEHVVHGWLNKQIAADMGTGEKTVKVHRGRLMTKMGVRSVAELVRLCARVGVALDAPISIDSTPANWRLSTHSEFGQIARTTMKSNGRTGSPFYRAFVEQGVSA